jgi:ubiquitin-activating enzyme E1
MKRPLDKIETASTTTTTTDSSDTTNKNNNSYSSSPPHKSQRMGSSLVCPKHDNQKTSKMNEDHSDNDQVEQMDAIATGEVDEKLYSRQLYVMGHEAQRRMMASNALLFGLSGLGAEVAKNCILAGISSITLCDPNPVSSFDLGGNFYLTEKDVGSGKSRATLSCDKLSELNQYVKVSVADVPSLSTDSQSDILNLVENVSVVIVTIPLPRSLLIALNDKCRSIGASFIYSVSTGVFGKVFCDFGKAFVVSDKDGEQPHQSQIEFVDHDSTPPNVRVLEDQGRHGLETGDYVSFSRVQGLDGLLADSNKEYKIKSTGPYSFELVDEDFTSASCAATQGYITQVKKPITMSFQTYENALETPEELMMSDFAKFDRPPLLHLAYKALDAFMESHDMQLPVPGDATMAAEFVDLAKSLDKDSIIADEKAERILKHLASGSRAVLSPMCALLGGIVGQEVLKACSGKFSPIKGFLYFDADETLPDDLLPSDEVSPSGSSRYDSQIAVFGKEMQKRILDQKQFLVGAGAIGCEMLKNWALMGVACGPEGQIHITDMDRIEKSNLSRQFLFRSKHINHFKSACAAEAAEEMNADIKIKAYQEKVGPETENIFGDDFYDKLTGVCTALDNVEARLYVDQKCLFYRLPMLESGTLGTKGNTQVVVPHLTENYGATRDPPEKSIPVCTLKNFPNQIQHTLQWARDYFEGVFKQSAEDVNSYLTSSNFADSLAAQQNTKLDTLQSIQSTLVDDRPRSFDDCIVWARLKFEDLFSNQIQQLLHNFPKDQITSSGSKFWSGSKRCPNHLSFDLDNKCEDAAMRNHFDFIVAAANLRASMYGIKGRTDEEYFRSVLKDVIVPDFTPKSGVKIAANDAEAEANSNSGVGDVDADCNAILDNLPDPSKLAGFKLSPIEFDKDIDEHMLFVTACSNLRALNYGIPTEDTHRSRAIAGRIIPAIATTTALVTGLICLEMYKIIGTPRKELTVEAYKSGFVNLAIPFITLSEPTAPAKTKAILKGKEWNWTAWDSLDISEGDLTLGELMEYFKTNFNLEIQMLSQGVSILYSFFANKKKVEERMKMPMSKIITSITKKEFPPNQLFIILELIANDIDTDEEVEIPYVKFRFR